ncbi:MAG: hypothetical protein ACYS0D_15875 [Planctomycetota bacterium]|jgi:hypothetical protein
MSERIRVRPQPAEEIRPAAPGGGAGGAGGPAGEGVIVGSGLFYERLPVAGLTIAEIRERFADRLDIDPAATAVVDGDAVDDEGTVVRSGQMLTFFQQAGEKGVREEVTISGRAVTAASPEGVRARMGVDAFVEALTPQRLDTCGIVMPDGVRLAYPLGRMTVLVWEISPQVHHVRWITDDSPSPFSGRVPGRPVKYRSRRLALPYLVVFAVFASDGRGRLTLSSRNEAYFRNEPITSPDDELCFPALLNISKFPDGIAATRPLAWICTQHTGLEELAVEPDTNRRIRRGLLALKRTVLEAGFNYSSEHHELTSYWSLSKERIPEVADLDRWEKLSRKDPLFSLEVDWLPATWNGERMTVTGIVDRIAEVQESRKPPMSTASDLARIVFNHKPSGKGAKDKQSVPVPF